MNRSLSLDAFAPAFAKAQRKVKHATRNMENLNFQSRYADLASVHEACLKALNDCGIGVLQFPRLVVLADKYECRVDVETMLLHESGQFISDTLGMNLERSDAHGIGSGITMARRYGLASIAGVAPADDDGNKAAETQPGETLKARVRIKAVAFVKKSGLWTVTDHADKKYKTTDEPKIAEAKAAVGSGREFDVEYLQGAYHRNLVTIAPVSQEESVL